MRILILGGDGMLGHQLFHHFAAKGYDVKVSLRQDIGRYSDLGIYNSENTFDGVDLRNVNTVEKVLSMFRPKTVVNAAGIVKQRPDSQAVLPSLEINALLPHRLANLARKIQARLILISTDCVFSGKKGRYTEDDFVDADDVYGRTKFLGEVKDVGCLTLRTSIIGLELKRKTSLIEWFLAQRGEVKGFTKAIFSGFTTFEMSRIIERIVRQHDDLYGVWHVASNPISKYRLLKELADRLDRKDVEIRPSPEFQCDRSLIADRFNTRTGYKPPSWGIMLDELVDEIIQRVINDN